MQEMVNNTRPRYIPAGNIRRQIYYQNRAFFGWQHKEQS